MECLHFATTTNFIDTGSSYTQMVDVGSKKEDEQAELEYQEPLIPRTVLDEASQRYFIVSLFVLIQSWKVYDVILIKSDNTFDGIELTSLNNFSFVIKYALVDGIFFWILPILNIQYLRFGLLKTMILTLLMNGFTFFLVSDFTVPILTGVILPIWNKAFQKRELTITGDSVNLNNIIDMNSHFKGKLTINYLPDSSAKFNPFHFDQLCLDHQVVQMPIEFNTSTQLSHLQIEHTTIDNRVRHIDFRGYKLNKLLKNDYSHLSKYKDYIQNEGIFYIEIPIKEPGKYKISKVVDSKNNAIRTYKSEFILSTCPQAQFVYPKSFDLTKNYKCVGKNDDGDYNLPFLQLDGVAPVNAQLRLKLNGNTYKTFKVTYGEKGSVEDLSWLKTQPITLNTLEQEILLNPQMFDQIHEGCIEFQLLSVTDYFGNTRRYNPASKDKDIFFSYEIKRSPLFGLVDKDPSRSELIVDGTKTLQVTGLENLNENDYPISMVIAYKDANDTTHNITKIFNKPSEILNGIEVNKPGIYQLVSSDSKYCPCQIDKQNIVQIIPAPPPELELSAKPVVNKCLGTTAFEFEFKLKGKAPFIIEYKVYQKQSNGVLKPVYSPQGTVARHIRTLNRNHIFDYKPPGEGNYVVTFYSLKDANNPKGVDLDTNRYTYQTYFKQVSKISFNEHGSGQKVIKMCFGDSHKVPLHFTGNGPYSFQYDIIDMKTGKKLINTVTVNNVSEFEIPIPKNLGSSRFEIKLSNMMDKFSCAAIMDKLEKLIVSARTEIPEALLDVSKSHFQIVEGDYVEIPIKIKSSTGNSMRDKIGYKITSLSDPTKFVIRNLSNRVILAKDEGIYSLETFENDGCLGTVLNQNQVVKVTYLPKPRLTVSSSNTMKQHLTEREIHLKAVCQNCVQTVELQLEGSLPFVVEYEVKLPNGKCENRLMNVEKNKISIKLPTNIHGRYVHTFKGIYDKLYTKSKSRSTMPNPQIVQYDVHELPDGIFPKENVLQICENRISKSDKAVAATIPIALTGSPPFKIKATLFHDKLGSSEVLFFENVNEGLLDLYYNKNIGLGEHVLTINEVIDGNGCKRDDFSPSNNYILTVTEVPNIEKSINKYHYCVGDYIRYNMTGVSPFTVYYNFRGKKQRATLDSRFIRLAAKPGKLYIEGLHDSSANQCLVNFSASDTKMLDLSLEVHNLPSVELQKGDYIIEDINQGDQTELRFTFQGTPPFKLTYVRTNEIGTGKNLEKILERHTIEDIWDFEYIATVSLAGTYEAIIVEDKYCQAVRQLKEN